MTPLPTPPSVPAMLRIEGDQGKPYAPPADRALGPNRSSRRLQAGSTAEDDTPGPLL